MFYHFFSFMLKKCGCNNKKPEGNKCPVKCRMCNNCSEECFQLYSTMHCYCCASLLSEPGKTNLEVCLDCRSYHDKKSI